jgi:hypothetical protein
LGKNETDQKMKLSERLRVIATETEQAANAAGIENAKKLRAEAATLKEAAETIAVLDPREKFEQLRGATHLVLYFATAADADAFASVVREAIPSLQTHRLP